MIKFLIVGQQLRIVTPVVVADSINYLECEADFTGDEWDGLYKWAHFTLDGNTYHVPFHDDKIVASQHLDLTEGTWKVSVTGNEYTNGAVSVRATTTVDLLKVENKSDNSDFPEITPSFSETLATEIENALDVANSVKEAADAGDYDGATFLPNVDEDGNISWTNDKDKENPVTRNIRGPQGPAGVDGTTLTINGFFDTLAELKASITSPSAGDAYGVAQPSTEYVPVSMTVSDELLTVTVNNPNYSAVVQNEVFTLPNTIPEIYPYDIYVWDAVNSTWKNCGPLKGANGNAATLTVGTVTKGEAGTDPTIINAGTNTDAILNFKIPEGYTPQKGTDYFTPNEIADVASEAAQQVSIETIGGIADPNTKAEGQVLKYNGKKWLAANNDVTSVDGLTGAVTTRIIQNNIAVSAASFQEMLTPTYEQYPYYCSLAIDGVTSDMVPFVVFSPAAIEEGVYAPIADTYNGGVMIYASDAPEADMVIPTIIIWR